MRPLLMTLAVGLMLASNAAQADDAKKDVDQLQGTWKMESFVLDGKPVEKMKGATRTIDGEKLTITIGKDVYRKATFKIDSTKSPKWMDLSYTEGPDKGKTRLGIYTLEGDTQKICYGALDSKERPTEFASKPGSGHQLVIFKRVKP
jgi:uncharacterized protein (TIGR03067 family)